MELWEHNEREHGTELTLLNAKTDLYNTQLVQEYSIPIFVVKDFFFFFGRKQLALKKVLKYSSVSNIMAFALSFTRTIYMYMGGKEYIF